MKIKYFAHSSFQLSSAKGTRLLTDPYESGSYGGAMGYKKIDEPADVITISHNHADHNYISREHDKARVFREAGAFVFKGISVKGVSLYHDSSRGSERGACIAFIYTVDGMTLCHLGDLGHVLSKSEASQIGPVDVLMIPVGGTFTVDAGEAGKVIESLSPKICLPMHYKTKSVGFNLGPLEDFTAGRSNIKIINSSEVEVTKTLLPKSTEVWVLKPSKL
jgi:L-ascorbate metabolism protein UlaG (beta-lactamase superfamily)